MVEATSGLTEAQATLETEMNRLADEYLPDEYGYGADANIEGLTDGSIRVHHGDRDTVEELVSDAAADEFTFTVQRLSETASMFEVVDINRV